MPTLQSTRNGIDTEKLTGLVEDVSRDPANGSVGFTVCTAWKGGTRSEARVTSWEFAGREIAKDFTICADEPDELCGANTAPNPQELLLAGLNACMMIGYVAGCAVHGIELEQLEIESDGRLDLRGFLGLDENIKPGYEEVHYTVRIKADGTPEQLREIHENVKATSPNFSNFATPIRLKPHLVIE